MASTIVSTLSKTTLPAITKSKMRVLISGSGVAGPSLAWFLARMKHNVTVLEKAPCVPPHGQNIDISGAAITAIKKMGLHDEFLKHHTREKGTRFVDARNRPYASFPVNDENLASLTSPYEILRADLAQMLIDATEKDVSYRFSTTISKVLSNDDKSVRVELSTGEVQEYDLLVVADGQWSKLRKMVFPDEWVKPMDTGMYVVYWTLPRLPSDSDDWNIYHTSKARIASLRPDPHGTVRGMFLTVPKTAEHKKEWETVSRADMKSKRDLLHKWFHDAGWQSERLLSTLDEDDSFYFQDLKQIKMSQWHKGRVVCLGDTAWAPTPLTGQGTSLAVNGSYFLAAAISKLPQNMTDPREALADFERTFRPWVETFQKIPGFPIIPGIIFQYSTLGTWVINSLLWAASKIVALPSIQRKVKSQSKYAAAEANDEGFPLPTFPSLEPYLVREQKEKM